MDGVLGAAVGLVHLLVLDKVGGDVVPVRVVVGVEAVVLEGIDVLILVYRVLARAKVGGRLTWGR